MCWTLCCPTAADCTGCVSFGEADAGIPILLLTGLTTQEDILHGLRSGGDDYLTKPYDFEILLARIEALLRRSERVPETITKGHLTLDVAAGVVLLGESDLLLTKKEFALLLIFVQNPERFIDGEYLYEKVWKQPFPGCQCSEKHHQAPAEQN